MFSTHFARMIVYTTMALPMAMAQSSMFDGMHSVEELIEILFTQALPLSQLATRSGTLQRKTSTVPVSPQGPLGSARATALT